MSSLTQSYVGKSRHFCLSYVRQKGSLRFYTDVDDSALPDIRQIQHLRSTLQAHLLLYVHRSFYLFVFFTAKVA